PFDELVEPGQLFDRVDPLYSGQVPIAQLNHPLAPPEFGRDLGFPRALGMNLLQDLPAAEDGTAQGIYVRVPLGSHHRNNDNQALRDGLSMGTNGPLVSATIRDAGGTDRGYGLKPFQPAQDARLQIDVSAAPWVPVDEIRIIVNGQVAKTISGSALSRPADPF